MKEKKDIEARKLERKALSIVDYKFSDNGKWIYRLENGQDYGCDCSLELVDDDDTLQGKRALCQVKGRSNINIINCGKTISFPLEAETYNMAISANYLFIFLLVNLKDETIYFQKLNHYGQETTNDKTINIHIPVENKFPNNESLLINVFNNANL